MNSNSEQTNNTNCICLKDIFRIALMVAFAVLICVSIKQNFGTTVNTAIGPTVGTAKQIGGIFDGIDSTVSPLSSFPDLLN